VLRFEAQAQGQRKNWNPGLRVGVSALARDGNAFEEFMDKMCAHSAAFWKHIHEINTFLKKTFQ
jgi:hypothetical protein